MRLRIRHETTYAYDTAAKRALQALRLTPRGHDGQFIVDWRIDIDHDCRLDTSQDAFGNTLHTFTIDGAIDRLTIVAEGRVETSDTAGLVNGTSERWPAQVFLRDTALTESNAAIRDLARASLSDAHADPLNVMHAVMQAIRARMTFQIDATDSGTSAIEAFGLGTGVCQDFAHVFIAAARHLGIPARYVSGYMRRDDMSLQGAGHAWAEALIDGLGWVGFDPANGICPTESYVRVAAGLDYLGAAPVRGVRFGGAGEALDVRIVVEESTRANSR